MSETFDRTSPEIVRLTEAINEWIWGRWLSSWGTEDATWFRSRTGRYRVGMRWNPDWLKDPLNQDGGEEKAHPFRLYDLETRKSNLATLLAIAAEPLAYERIHGRLRLNQPPEVLLRLAQQERERDPSEPGIPAHRLFERQFEAYSEDREHYEPVVQDVFRQIGEERIERERRELCMRSEIFESNLTILRVCRLMSAQDREHLHGPIGYAMLLREMAESIRYVAEAAFGKELPEEDMFGGAGRWEEAKLQMCGQLRMLDSLEARHHFLRRIGLDFGRRAVCYVEGETEAGALRALFPADGSVGVINLRGQGETPTLRQMLEKDREERVFTAMVLDADREDRIREARQLAQEGLLTLGFAICDPDFEYGIGATDADRLAALELLWERRGAEAPFPLDPATISGAASGKELAALAAAEAFPSVKSSDWGELLVGAVHSHTTLEVGHPNPFWDLVLRLLQARQPTYLYETTVNSTSINTEDGRIESKPPGNNLG